MGADHYFTAIKDYLEVHAYSNATERGLFDSFQKIIDKENIKIDGESENLGPGKFRLLSKPSWFFHGPCILATVIT